MGTIFDIILNIVSNLILLFLADILFEIWKEKLSKDKKQD